MSWSDYTKGIPKTQQIELLQFREYPLTDSSQVFYKNTGRKAETDENTRRMER